MTKKLYVGNLSYDTTEQAVRDLLEEYGTIQSIAMINDRDSGNFRGFCFVEMEDSAANAAVNALNGKEVDGRALKVNEAKPREERGGPRGGGGNWGGNRGGGSGPRGGGGNRGSGSGPRGGGGNRGGGGDRFSGGGGRR